MNSGLPYPIRCSGDSVKQVEIAGVPLEDQIRIGRSNAIEFYGLPLDRV